MNGAVAYGSLLAVAMLLLDGLLVTPTASLIFWLAVAVQLAMAAVITWRRTGLLLTAASMTLAAGISIVLAVAAARGIAYDDALRAYPLETVAVVALLLFLFVEEHRRHPALWARWGEHQEHCSLRDYLMLRHIPDLRSTR